MMTFCTNNAVESWHAAFQGSIQCAHPTLWKLIAALIKENGLQETLLAQTLGGSQPTRKKKHYDKINKALTTLCTKQDTIPCLDFLRGISYNLEMNV